MSSRRSIGEIATRVSNVGWPIRWVAVLLALCVALAASSAVAQETGTVQLAPATRQWLDAHQPFVVGISSDPFPPYYQLDAQSRPEGLAVDYLALLAARSDVRLDYRLFQTWADVEQALIDGEIDLTPAVASTPDRTPRMRFTSAFIDTLPVIVRRRDSNDIQSLADLGGRTVAVESGYALQRILSTRHPEIDLRLVADTREALEDVAAAKADAYVGLLPSASTLIERHLLSNLVIAAPAPQLRTGDLRIAVRLDAPQLVQALDNALFQLADDDHRALRQRWIPTLPDLRLDTPPPLPLTAEERAWLDGLPALRYGADANAQPLDFFDAEGRHRGIVAEYLSLAQAQLGLTIQIVPELDRDSLHTALDERRIDILTAVDLNPEREHVLSAPLITLPAVLITRLDAPYIGALSDLDGGPLALVGAYSDAEQIRRLAPDLALATFPSLRQALDAVDKGEAAAAMAAAPLANALIQEAYLGRLAVAVPLAQFAQSVRLELHPDLAPLKPLLDRALLALPPGERERIAQRWLGPLPKTGDWPPWARPLPLAVVLLAVLLAVLALWNYRLRRAVRHGRAAEIEADDAHAQLLAITENLPGAVYQFIRTKDGGRRLAFVSSRIKTLVGLSAAEAMADFTRVLDAIVDEDRKAVDDSMREAANALTTWQHDFRMRCADGRVRWMHGHAEPRFRADGSVVWNGYWVDINDRKSMEAALSDARHDAERANTAKSDFLARMSHEIRTPLNAVVGLTQLLDTTPLNPLQTDYVSKLGHASKALMAVVNDILDLSRIEAGKFTLEQAPFLLESVLDTVCGVTRTPLAGKPVELIVRLDPGLPRRFVGDAGRLTQILINLCGNAVKFTERGEVELAIELHQRRDDRLILRFRVRDTGIGMPAEHIERLFDAFAQADESVSRRYGGTGLGLTICRHLARAMGGRIQAFSAPGEGSAFEVTLPLAVDPDQQPLERFTDHPVVVVVEPHQRARHVVMNLLEQSGAVALGFETVDELLATLESGRLASLPRLLLIADTAQVDSDAWLDRLAPEGRAIPFVVMSAEPGRGVARWEQHGRAILAKPVLAGALHRLLLELLYGKPLAAAPAATPLELPLNGRRILVVDDNDINRDVARKLLMRSGAEVIEAADGREALRQLDRQAVDLVLMDVQMPGMDGLTATRAIRQRADGQGLPVLAMTASVLPEDRERCIQAGMDGHVVKPFAMARLLEAIAQWLPPSTLDDGSGLPGRLPGICLSDGLRHMDGDQHLLLNVLSRFREQQSTAIARLQDALHAGEQEVAHRLLHTLKGLAETIGAHALADEARTLEAALAAGHSPARDALTPLEGALHEVLGAIDLLIARRAGIE